MTSKPKRYFLKVTNPNKGTNHFITNLCKEFCLQVREYWEKKDDPEIKLYSRPIYTRNFNHIIYLYSNNLCYVKFIEYLIHRYLNIIEDLEDALELSITNKEMNNAT